MKYHLLFYLITLISCTQNKQSIDSQKDLYDYDVEARLDQLGIVLIEPTVPDNSKIKFAFATTSGNMVYLSGNGPITADNKMITGKLGKDLTIDEGYAAARLTGIRLLGVLKKEIGDLNKVEKIVKVFGMVNSDPSFTDQPLVINGFTDLMIDVFGERGVHARSAVGMATLPWNLACEIEMIVQIRE